MDHQVAASFLNELYIDHKEDTAFAYFYDDEFGPDIDINNFPNKKDILAIPYREVQKLRNLDYEIAVKGVFKLLSDQPDHPYFWARFLEVPFMMVYRDGFPQGFYNGSIDLKSLTEFCTDYVSLKGAQIDKRHLLRSENLDSMYLRQAKLAQLQNLSLPDINEYTSIETEEDLKRRGELRDKREEKGKIRKSYKNQLIAPSIEY